MNLLIRNTFSKSQINVILLAVFPWALSTSPVEREWVAHLFKSAPTSDHNWNQHDRKKSSLYYTIPQYIFPIFKTVQMQGVK